MHILDGKPQEFSLKTNVDERGSLVSLEFPNFKMKRFYYIEAPRANVKRGFHAHKKLTQIFIPLVGTWKISLLKHRKVQEVTLRAGQNYLILPPGYWREFESLEDFSILGVLADDIFLEEDYIRDLGRFEEWEKQVDSVF